MANPSFTHVHCSSRFDRTPASLEQDVDYWRTISSVITLTEVANNSRGATLREQGWGYFNNQALGNGNDECAVLWDMDYWTRGWAGTQALSNVEYYNLRNMRCKPVHSIDCILNHRNMKYKLLVSCTHMPAHVEGRGGNHWRT